jgi:hypothetical protein
MKIGGTKLTITNFSSTHGRVYLLVAEGGQDNSNYKSMIGEIYVLMDE